MIREIAGVIKREWKWMLFEKKYLILALVAPIVFTLTVDLVYSHKKVLALPVVFVDQDHSQLSRAMIRAVLSNETFKSAGMIGSAEEFPEQVAEDRAHVCFVFPYGMERDLKARRGARVEVLVDESNYLAGSVEMNNAIAVFKPFSVLAEVRMMEALKGAPPTLALRRSMPVDVGVRTWFNPGFTSNYLNFVAIGTAYIALQLAALVIAIRSGSSEFGERSFQPLRAATQRPFVLAAGKVLAYLAPLLPVYLLVMLMPHLFFGAPLARTGISFWVVLIWFPATMITFSYGLSAMTKDAVFASEISTVLTLPNFLASGYTWPDIAFPKALLLLKYGMPMATVAFMMRKITLMGGTLADCGNQLWALTGWTIVAVVLAWSGTRRILAHNTPGGN